MKLKDQPALKTGAYPLAHQSQVERTEALARKGLGCIRAKVPCFWIILWLIGVHQMVKASNGETLIIVPTYNERDNLPVLVGRLFALPVSLHLLIVDDNSPDGTGDLAESLAVRNPRINVLHRGNKEGLGKAYLAGFAWALQRGYEFIFEMDGDLSHNPDDIPLFLEAAKNADLVIGSRYCNGIRVINWPLRRLMLSLSAAKYVQLITGMPFSDPTGGFKCFRRHTLESIHLPSVDSNGYSFQIEMTHKVWRQGLRIVEVPIIFTDRFQGTSKMSPKIVREALRITWKMLFQNRLHRSPRKRASYTSAPPLQA